MSDTALRYLALGDSYTIGEAVSGNERWPARLAARLCTRGLPLADPRIVAATGWTIAELDAAMTEARLTPGWDLVSLLIGVNDQYRGLDRCAFSESFEAMLDRAVGLCATGAARTFVLSIPDWGVTPFGRESGRDRGQIAAELDWCNRYQASAARDRGVRWFDITAISRAADDQVAADGLHPSGSQYTRWVDRIIDGIEQLLDDGGAP